MAETAFAVTKDSAAVATARSLAVARVTPVEAVAAAAADARMMAEVMAARDSIAAQSTQVISRK
jgi:hypothetical protein